ncbi:MAG: ATP phosphoribosyltransferase [Methanomethylophilus sp.]
MTVKMAIPNKGRLNVRAVELVSKAGIGLGDSLERKLSVRVPDLDLEIFFVRAQDIPTFIASGAVDFGLTGQDLVAEAGYQLEKLLDLNFGQCRLAIAGPEYSPIVKNGVYPAGVRVATSYPRLTRRYFEEQGVAAEIVPVQGAAEIMPHLGVSDLISDLVATGDTLRMNRLQEIDTVMASEASVFASAAALADSVKRTAITEIVESIRAVMAAENRRYLMADVPKAELPEVEKILPGIGGPTVLEIAGHPDVVAVQAVIPTKDTYRVVNALKKIGGRGILTVAFDRLVE